VKSTDHWSYSGEIEILMLYLPALTADANVDSVVELPRSASSATAVQNHALDMRINVEGRRAQKTYERLVVFARELDRET
jgi:hypothetical protein